MTNTLGSYLAQKIRAGRAANGGQDLPSLAEAESLWAVLSHEVRVGVVCVAAGCWRSEGQELEERLELEVSGAREAEARLADAEWAKAAASVRRLAAVPTADELRERRTMPARPGDYPGRLGGVVGVDFHTGRWLREAS